MTTASHEQVERALRDAEWLARVRELRNAAPDRRDDAALLRRLAKGIQVALQANRGGTALRRAAAGLIFAHRKVHLIGDSLRPFTYDAGRRRKLLWVLTELARIAPECPVAQGHTGALSSWVAFAGLALAGTRLEVELESRIGRSPMRTLHGVLSLVDEGFDKHRRPRVLTFAPASFDELDLEQAASGAAHVLHLLGRMGRLSGRPLASLREARDLTKEECRDLIYRSYLAREMRELEVSVFRLGFKCVQDSPSSFRIEAPSDQVGFGLSYGWYQANSIPPIRLAAEVSETLRIRTLAEAFSANMDEGPYVLKTNGERPHFSYRIREGHAAAVGLVVNRAAAFREEEIELRIAADHLKLPIPELLTFEVKPGVLVRDVVRFQRLLGFLSLTRSHELLRSELSDDQKRAARLLFMNTAMFLQIAAACGLEPSLAHSLVEAFAWKPASGSHLDLQHSPIVILDDHVVIPLSVATESNLIRNGLWSSRTRPHADGRTDPLVEDLRLAFDTAGIRSWRNVKYEWEGKTYEIDTIVLHSDHLLLIEAKNTLQPCSYFELRTTWDCLEKASEQLDRHLLALENESVRSRLSQRLGTDVAHARLHTCIVVGHPLLSGISLFGHPVRQCDVTCNFVASGSATFWIGQRSRSTRLRPEGKLEISDLLAFLGDENPVYRDAWASGLKRMRPVTIGKAHVAITEYMFSPVVQLARSGLCESVHQQRLEAALNRLNALPKDADQPSIDAAWAEAVSAHDAAFAALERSSAAN